jgi:tetratricopeptide (TPR) repeat protein
MREIQVRTEAAVTLTGKAIALHARLVRDHDGNREYKLELAKFRNNVAIWLLDLGRRDEAEAMNLAAITLLDDLNRPTATVGIEHADAYTLKGLIQARRRPADALGPFREALEGYKGLGKTYDLSGNVDFHRRFAELVSYMAQLTPASAMANAIADAATFYAPIADKALEAGQTALVGNVLASFSEYKAPLPASTRQTLDRLLSAHQQKTRGTAAR